MDAVRRMLDRSTASLARGATLRAADEAREALLLGLGDAELERDSLEALGTAMWARGELHAAAAVLAAADQLRQRGADAPPPNPVAELARSSPGWQDGLRLCPQDVLGMLDVVRSPMGRPREGWGSLTPSERQVVELAAEGLTNPRIAQKLFLSTNTVKTHLLRAYRKLGVTSRTELSQVRR
jgi:DNA-binding CsgD family transcriptional regulator